MLRAIVRGIVIVHLPSARASSIKLAVAGAARTSINPHRHIALSLRWPTRSQPSQLQAQLLPSRQSLWRSNITFGNDRRYHTSSMADDMSTTSTQSSTAASHDDETRSYRATPLPEHEYEHFDASKFQVATRLVALVVPVRLLNEAQRRLKAYDSICAPKNRLDRALSLMRMRVGMDAQPHDAQGEARDTRRSIA